MFEKGRLKKIAKAKLKKVKYMGVELFVPEDFYDRPVKFGSVIFHLESIKRGYQIHALAGSRDYISKNLTYDGYYANLSTSLLNILGKNGYLTKTKSIICDDNNLKMTTEVYRYDWEGSDMQVCYVWMVFKKKEQYVLFYATGPAYTINDKYEEYLAIAKTIKC